MAERDERAGKQRRKRKGNVVLYSFPCSVPVARTKGLLLITTDTTCVDVVSFVPKLTHPPATTTTTTHSRQNDAYDVQRGKFQSHLVFPPFSYSHELKSSCCTVSWNLNIPLFVCLSPVEFEREGGKREGGRRRNRGNRDVPPCLLLLRRLFPRWLFYYLS